MCMCRVHDRVWGHVSHGLSHVRACILSLPVYPFIARAHARVLSLSLSQKRVWRRWGPAEEEALQRAVNKHGTKDWTAIVQEMNTDRSVKQLQVRGSLLSLSIFVCIGWHTHTHAHNQPRVPVHAHTVVHLGACRRLTLHLSRGLSSPPLLACPLGSLLRRDCFQDHWNDTKHDRKNTASYKS